MKQLEELHQTKGHKVFVIGNGFDIMHNLKTKYKYFKEFLLKEGIVKTDFGLSQLHMTFPSIWGGNTIGKIQDYFGQFNIIYWLVENKLGKADPEWNEFENSLGSLDYQLLLEKEEEVPYLRNVIEEAISSIEMYFALWISHIKFDDVYVNEKFKNLLDINNDFVVNFNYTEAIEKLYGMSPKNILYIHGKRETDLEELKKKKMTVFGRNNEKLVIGHGLIDKKQDRFDCFDPDTRSWLISLHNMLGKPTEDIIEKNNGFWDKLKNRDVTDIYSLGFSFSDVDIPYIKRICSVINENGDPYKKVWYLPSYNYEENEKKFKDIIRNAGFKGTFKQFDV